MLPTPAEKLQNFFGVFLQFHIGVDSESYIAVKTGLLVRALIFPVRTVNDKFIEQLSFLLRECQRTAENQAEPSGWEGAYQITWTEEAPGEDQP